MAPQEPPVPPGAHRAPRPGVRARDVVSVAVMGAGTIGLMVCLYFLNPLVAASAVCAAVIVGGAYLGMDDPEDT